MATTANTVFPIAAAPGARGTGAVEMATIPCLASVAFSPGDIVIIDGTTKDATVLNTPTGAIFGVAMCKEFTSAATIDRDGQINEDTVNVALAVAGARFTGNVQLNTTTDLVGVYATCLRVVCDIVVSDTSGYAALSTDATGTEVVFTQEFTSPQYDNVAAVWRYGRTAGVGVTNARVIFSFLHDATVWGVTGV